MKKSHLQIAPQYDDTHTHQDDQPVKLMSMNTQICSGSIKSDWQGRVGMSGWGGGAGGGKRDWQR